MQNHVTVIPADNLIIVNGQALCFDFAAPANLHAIQWHGGAGHMECTDGPNADLTAGNYAALVAPYVALWEAEKARLDNLAAEEAARREAEYNSTEARAARVRAERDRRLDGSQWIMQRHVDEVAAGGTTTLRSTEYQTWLTYRQALRDLPAQPGFPWDASEGVPWPVSPQ